MAYPKIPNIPQVKIHLQARSPKQPIIPPNPPKLIFEAAPPDQGTVGIIADPPILPQKVLASNPDFKDNGINGGLPPAIIDDPKNKPVIKVEIKNGGFNQLDTNA